MDDRYKVVINEVLWKGHFVSCMIRIESDFNLKYRLHEITWAPLGSLGIFVFDNLLDAKSFIGMTRLSSLVPGDPTWNDDVTVLRGEAIGERPCKVVALEESEFLTVARGGVHECHSWDCPPKGTLCCAGFKPTNIIMPRSE